MRILSQHTLFDIICNVEELNSKSKVLRLFQNNVEIRICSAIFWNSESAFGHPWTICCNSFIVFLVYALNYKDNRLISNSSSDKPNAIQIVTPDIRFSKENSLLMVQSRM
jgi:hypothetical protein